VFDIRELSLRSGLLIVAGLLLLVFSIGHLFERRTIHNRALNFVRRHVDLLTSPHEHYALTPNLRVESIDIDGDQAQVAVKIYQRGEWVRVSLAMQDSWKFGWQIAEIGEIDSFPQRQRELRDESARQVMEAQLETAFQGSEGVVIQRR